MFFDFTFASCFSTDVSFFELDPSFIALCSDVDFLFCPFIFESIQPQSASDRGGSMDRAIKARTSLSAQ